MPPDCTPQHQPPSPRDPRACSWRCAAGYQRRFIERLWGAETSRPSSYLVAAVLLRGGKPEVWRSTGWLSVPVKRIVVGIVAVLAVAGC
jgi:hypothetical protein